MKLVTWSGITVLNKSWKLIWAYNYLDHCVGDFVTGGFPSPESAERYNKKFFSDPLTGFSTRLCMIDCDDQYPYRTEGGNLRNN